MTVRSEFVLSRLPIEPSPFGRSVDGDDADLLARYERLATLYEAGLRATGSKVTRVEAPSIYQTEEALQVLGVAPSSAHIAVRPIADFRPFYGLPDYVVFDGPITELDRDVPNSLRSASDILSAAKGVLCTTDLLTQALHRRGVSNAITLAPPIDVSEIYALEKFAMDLRSNLAMS